MPEKVRIPRAEAEVFVNLLASQMPRSARWMIGGSWRRGSAAIGDVDVMVVTERGTFDGFRFPPCFEISHGDERIRYGSIRSLTGRSLPAQFWACNPAESGAMAMHITGPRDLNIRHRARAKNKGFKLSQYGLFKDGRQVLAFTEQDIYRELGMEYIEPEARNAAV